MNCTSIDNIIHERAEAIFDKMIAWRRDFHQNPELGNQEFRTSGIVAEHLKAIGVDEVYTGIGGSTSIIALLHGAQPGPMVALRADMDALAMKEDTGLPFASTVMQEYGSAGMVPVSHSCGHDCHTAMLMAAAEILVGLRDEIKGTVAFIFQAAEEGCASNWTKLTGMNAIVNDPIYKEKIKLDASMALHIQPMGECGTAGMVSYLPGVGSYNSLIFNAKIHGRGAHAKTPWEAIDPLVIGMQTINAMQTIISRNVNVYTNDATLSIGLFKGGDMYNVIPDSIEFAGAVRFTDLSTKDYLQKRVEDTLYHCAAAGGATSEISWTWYPAINNDPGLIEQITPELRALLGEENVVTTNIGLEYGVDDYSYLELEAPGIFAFLCVAPDEEEPGTIRPQLHNAQLIVNERGLLNGIKAMVGFALKYKKQ